MFTEFARVCDSDNRLLDPTHSVTLRPERNELKELRVEKRLILGSEEENKQGVRKHSVSNLV